MVFIRDIGNWSVPASQLLATFSEAIQTNNSYSYNENKTIFLPDIKAK